AVPAQPRSPLPADAAAPSADPTALPGNGARVVRGAPETPSDGPRGGRETAARPTTSNEGEGRPRGR
ncbi:two-component sensor histidine kinase, partial [Streptomyces sp. 8ZJF_21]|nr:two-component sensor histidine kinase [Streptomyces sp. 8ZJF_21]